jgi:carbamoyl-phosphate synthase large subunit
VLDYVVVKFPRFAFEKFPAADPTLGVQMKAVGETMAIGRTFKQAWQKGLRGLEIDRDGWVTAPGPRTTGWPMTARRRCGGAAPAHRRPPVPAEAGPHGGIHHGRDPRDHGPSTRGSWPSSPSWWRRSGGSALTAGTRPGLDGWQSMPPFDPPHEAARLLGPAAGRLLEVTEREVRERRWELGVRPTYHMVDTCAGEFPAATPYLYSSYESESEARPAIAARS